MRHKFHLLQDEIKYKVQSARQERTRKERHFRADHVFEWDANPWRPVCADCLTTPKGETLDAERRMKAKLIMAVYDFSELYSATFVIQGQKQEGKGLACRTLNIHFFIKMCDYRVQKQQNMQFVSQRSGSKGVNAFQRICGYPLLSGLLNLIMRAEHFSSIQWVQDLHDMPQSVML